MSNTDHLSKLFQGPAAWNEWRANNPEIVPDLRDAALTASAGFPASACDARLDLSGALLKRADLTGSILSGANLASADLREANLLEARLAGADLSFANLTNARLDDADLAGAELAGALIAGARLNLARNLTQAQVEAAYGDDATLLPPGLTMPAAWREPLALATGIGPMNMLPPDWLAFDPYAVLEIDRKAKMADARAAYLRLAKRFHPDLNPGDEIAEQRFKNINHAYRVLAARDEMRRRNRRGRSTPPWAAAAGLFFLAFTIPGALVYWLDVPALIGRAERLDRTTRPERQTVTALLGIADAADRAVFTASAGPPSGPLPRSTKGPRLKAHENAAERVNTAATVSGAPSIIAAAAKTYDRTATPGEAEKGLTGAAVYAEPLNEDAREGATVTSGSGPTEKAAACSLGRSRSRA